ncbi:unnamed protein product [Owenia fusiformis]|uniref:glutathione transferase n=1 Tax=Owenia fusiformis TaxID=6347 RepID=A0A8J1T730_OWEFU|nr:unnamed protein product [Owenia fusiformis]
MSSKSKFTLTYFTVRGRGELIRLLFHYAGKEFEDVRIEWKDWAALKPDTPYLSLPILEHGGVTIGQSVSIARYVAKELGLAGKTTLEQALTDGINDSITDTFNELTKHHFEQDETKKEELKSKYMTETLPKWCELIEKQLETKVNGDGTWLVGDQISWADIGVFNFLNCMELMKLDNGFSRYPNLNALKERVQALEGISKYISERPESTI